MRVNRFVEIQVICAPGSHYQFIALLKVKPDINNPMRIGMIPANGEACPNYSSCVGMLSEAIAGAPQLDTVSRLLGYYEGLSSQTGREGVVNLYESAAIAASQKPNEHFTRWGDAYVE